MHKIGNNKMKLFKGCLYFLGLLLVPMSVPATTLSEHLDMFAGEIKILENVEVNRIAVGNGNLMKVKALPNTQLLLIAEKPGSTTLHLWYKDGRESDINIKISKEDEEKRVRLEDMIKMDVRIIEFRKSALRSLGINWSNSIQGPSGAFVQDWSSNSYFRGENNVSIFNNLPNQVSPAQSYFGIATSITSRINFLASNGDAVTLAEPNLSCINGQGATFLAGGEVPIPIRGSNGEVTVDYKPYGIILDIKPVADANGVIKAYVKTEVSQLDHSVDVLGAPGFLVRKTTTQMNVHNGETIVISGLLNSESSKDVNKIPLLGDIPILGQLFRSTDFRNAQTELVVFVTPRIVRADDESNQKAISNYTKRAETRMKVLREKLDIGLAD
jgi:pilus assembly protein CpaC